MTTKRRNKHDHIIVQEKLDGSNCSVAKIGGDVIPIGRKGYHARTSTYEQHHFFADWVEANRERFDRVLREGERLCGEWMALAHGTRYELKHEPFVVFDLMVGIDRALHDDLKARVDPEGFVMPRIIHRGDPISIEAVLSVLEPSGHGAIDMTEGAVWRLETIDLNTRKPFVLGLAKYVRQEKTDGIYLKEISGGDDIWNWHPGNP